MLSDDQNNYFIFLLLLNFVIRTFNIRSITLVYFEVYDTVLLATGTVLYSRFKIFIFVFQCSEKPSNHLYPDYRFFKELMSR